MPPRPQSKAAAVSISSTFVAFLLLVPLLATSAHQDVDSLQSLSASSSPDDSNDFIPPGHPIEESLLDTFAHSFAARNHKLQPQEDEGIEEIKEIKNTIQRNKHYENSNQHQFILSNERAVATLAPVDQPSTVRAPPPARRSGSSAGISSRHQARSLQDWEVADFVLLATVDGKIHARDRMTGEPRWALEADGPMVETTYHRHNKTRPQNDREAEEEFLWVVEPSQDGRLYVFSAGPNPGMQKLGLTVKQLVEELSPYAGEDPPVVYTGEKKNTLYTVDAASGQILKIFSSSGSTVIDEGSCRRMNGLEGLDDEECESIGTLTLGRTEYTIGIQHQTTGEAICTIKFFEWAANNRDRDLHNQYSSTMDNKYVYSKFDGSVFVLDHSSSGRLLTPKPLYRQKFSSPVARVYDVARPFEAESSDPNLVLLPQPIGPATSEDDESRAVFVNCTNTGSLYALSETSYPTVTDGAKRATCYNPGAVGSVSWERMISSAHKRELVGLHPLTTGIERRVTIPTISGPDIDVPQAAKVEQSNEKNSSLPLPIGKVTSMFTSFAAETAKIMIIALLGGYALSGLFGWNPSSVLQGQLNAIPASHFTPSQSRDDLVPPADVPLPDDDDDELIILLRAPDELDALTEPTATVTDPQTLALPSSTAAFPQISPSVDQDEMASAETGPGGETPKPKKKAHRGQRGGRKRRKAPSNVGSKDNEEEAVRQIVEDVKNIGRVSALQADDAITQISSVTDIADEIELNNLKIYTDKILGAGSGGTFVFEGTFEGRLVAVKRMLPQYFELASQEVSLLQQSDDHPNVIRYFCQQRDQNFLYIAVELCQASLWDLYQSEEPLTEERSDLLADVSRDVPKALFQLASGLRHLHDLRIVHRDIKPQNILVAYPKKNQQAGAGPRFVISDFGLCKTLPDNASTLIGTTGNAGTVGWKAPELINVPATAEGRPYSSLGSHSRDSSSSSDGGSSGTGVKRAVDIFSLGCVFFFVLTGGSHPYDDAEGWVQLRELNVKKGVANLSALDRLGDDAEEPRQLLLRMLAHRPEARPSAREVLQHPFFWNADRRLAFLCDASDHWERETRDPPSDALATLESFAPEVLDHRGDFLAVLDRRFVDALGRQRKYVGNRLLDLLRALRNKRNHYEDLTPELQARVGPLPSGYLRYWTSRFPKLLMACYQAVEACELQNLPRFRPYFEGIDGKNFGD